MAGTLVRCSGAAGVGCPGGRKEGAIYRQDAVQIPGMAQGFYQRSVDPNKLGFPWTFILGDGGGRRLR